MTAADLREKLQRDFEKLKAEPLSVDAAFNFFVTADHMRDWLYPKHVNDERRKKLKENSILLQICYHLANGAKHFEPEGKQNNSVSSTDAGFCYYPTALYPKSFYPEEYYPSGRLIVNLKGEAARKFGQVIGVMELAEKVLNFWNNHPIDVTNF